MEGSMAGMQINRLEDNLCQLLYSFDWTIGENRYHLVGCERCITGM